MALDPENKKRLRGIGHALHPLVTVAGKGLSESVCLEAERALHDHELIKICFALPDRALRHPGRCPRGAGQELRKLTREPTFEGCSGSRCNICRCKV